LAATAEKAYASGGDGSRDRVAAMAASSHIIQVAVPTPLRRAFDYISPVELPPGTRVRVSFGRREVVGIVVGEVARSDLPHSRLKPITESLDAVPLLAPPLLDLLRWAADYYHHPLGEVIHAALPARLRQGRAAVIGGVTVWTLTSEARAVDPETLKRAPAQKRLLQVLAAAPEGLDAVQLAQISPRWAAGLKAMHAKGWVSSHQRDSGPSLDRDTEASP